MTDTPQYPHQALIDSYGNGGFRFAGMSHRGSILCLPSSMRAWAAVDVNGIGDTLLSVLSAEAEPVEILLIGTGRGCVHLEPSIRRRFRAAGLEPEVMDTGAAVRTYNVLLAEDRRVAAALIAIE